MIHVTTDKKVAKFIVAQDGTGDFSDIQSAINALPSNGGLIYIKDGTYSIISAITISTSNVSLFGNGFNTSIKTTSNIGLISVSSVSGIIIKDIYLSGSSSGVFNTGIRFSGVTNSIIENCWIKNCGYDGIILNSTSYYNIIKNNMISSCSNYGIEIEGDRNTFEGNVLFSNFYGVLLNTVNYNIFMGNVVELSSRHGITLTASGNNIIKGNIVKDNSQSSNNTWAEIVLQSASTYNIISDNMIDCTQANKSARGIGEGVPSTDYNVIVGNIVLNAVTANILESGANTIVAHNITS